MKPKLTQSGIELLRKVQEHIKAEPEALNIHRWICGTSACIAGHGVILAGKLGPEDSACPERTIPHKMHRLMFGDNEAAAMVYSGMLYSHHHWPESIRIRYKLARSATKRAQAASDAIDWFISEHS